MAGELKLNNVSVATESGGTVTIAPNNVQFAANHAGIKTALNASGSAPVYACRAWVNFDGTGSASNKTGTYSQSGTTITFTFSTDHDLVVGNGMEISFSSGSATQETFTVATVTSSTVMTATSASSRTTSGNFTAYYQPIRASGNVSSIAEVSTGKYIINFTNPLPDAHYAISGSASSGTATNGVYQGHPWAKNESSCWIWTGWQGTATAREWITCSIFR